VTVIWLVGGTTKRVQYMLSIP